MELNAIKLSTVLTCVVLTLCTAAAQAKKPVLYAYPIESSSFRGLVPTGINDSGRIVGYCYCLAGPPARVHGFITGPNGLGITDIGTLGSDIYPMAINAKGQIAGYYLMESPDGHRGYRAFITSAGGQGLRDVDVPQDSPNSTAKGINESGQVVGYVSSVAGVVNAYISGPDGKGLTLLETLDQSVSEGIAVNGAGQVTGNSYTEMEMSHPFITGPGGVGTTYLDIPPYAYGAAVSAINDQGEISGSLNMGYGTQAPTQQFVTGSNGVGVTALGYLKHAVGTLTSYASGINQKGTVVGFSSLDNAANRFLATMTDSKNHLVNLNDVVVNLPPGVQLNLAVAINASGQMAVIGRDWP